MSDSLAPRTTEALFTKRMSRTELEEIRDRLFPDLLPQYDGIHKGAYRYGDDREVDERDGVRSAIDDFIDNLLEVRNG